MSSNRLLIVLLLVLTSCLPAQTARDGVAIPRHASPSGSVVAQRIIGLNYDPWDRAAAWPHPDTLIIAHVQQYSSADVYDYSCEGSGFYALAITDQGPPRPLGVGEPVCRALAPFSGFALDPTSHSVYASSFTLGDWSRLARMRLPNDPPETLPTGCEVYVRSPDISRDGRAIVFQGLCRDREQQEWELYIVGADGGGLRQVAGEAGYSAETPSWSPDARRLAYVRAKDTLNGVLNEIALIDVSGSNRRILAPGDTPAWSPDGQWLAYIQRDTPISIGIIRTDGTEGREVFRNEVRSSFSRGWGPRPEGEPSGPLVWSPDGRWIAFSRRYDAGILVWRVNVETGETQQVTRPGT